MTYSQDTDSKLVKCVIKKPPKISYRLGIITRTVSGPPTLVVLISVKSKHFKVKDMRMLASQLNEEFCHEPRLRIVLFDKEEAAKTYSKMYAYLTQQEQPGPLRGFYKLDREKAEESISFCTKRNNPLDEVFINLAQEKSEK